MKYNNGEEFLNKIYKDLHTTDEVEHAVIREFIKKDKLAPSEKITKYMERLEKVHNKANTENKKNIIKQLYYRKYVIKREILEDLGYTIKEQDKIISIQEKSLEVWIDYLTDKNNKYPMWAKYWAFQGMLKLGTLDENNTYGSRSEKTIAPFIEMNPEVLGKCIDLITSFIDGEELEENDDAVERLIETGNFKKIYTVLINKNKKESNLSSGIEGIWIKYNYKNKEDAKKLYDSLQGKSTGWCTAVSLEDSIDQICSGNGYSGGDFYVYYTKGKDGKYSLPRIAIRMNETDKIGEIRGVADSQNLEEEFEEVVASKLEEMEDVKNKEEYYKNIENSRRITKINKEVKNNPYLDKEDIIFIMQNAIDTFGWYNDPRIDEIKEELIIKDEILALELIEKGLRILRFASPELQNKFNIVLKAVQVDGHELKYASPELQDNYDIVFAAVSKDGYSLQYASPNCKDNYNIVFTAVDNVGFALAHASKRLRGNYDIVMTALEKDYSALKYAEENVKKEIESSSISKK